jgi:medium-chain acyl-[acyl-carrier-protein] hydrolase
MPIEIPGRGTRMGEKPFKSMKPLVEAIDAAINDHLDKPFALFGHSMGAIVGFELIHRIFSMRRVRPAHLFFSGRKAPHIVHPAVASSSLPDNEFVEKLRRLEGTPEEVLENPELFGLISPILRADFELTETYSYAPRPQLQCPITVLGGITDKDIIRRDLEAWHEHAAGPFSIQMFPGNHFFIHSHETRVLQTIANILACSC